ncbi:MAG TPA: acyl-CoA dehydratase activase [Anaeromyxobacteraceae bacterium]|nr:acyl-CoA dehydratase activase [Anaeromyxobacteraceae bacterium]
MIASPCYAGVDCGSWNTKAALVDAAGQVVATAIVRTGADVQAAAERVVADLLARAGVERSAVSVLWSTGFGRHALRLASGSRTELDAHARGALRVASGPLTVIDIGGQDAKIILVDAEGRRVSHKMNRKCAAGTGSFLEEMALRLDVRIGELPGLAARSTEEVELGSFCTVFTGTEVLGLIRQGRRPADLARAAYRSVVKRVLEMERVAGKVVATGGVIAHHPMVVELLEQAIGGPVIVPEHAQEIGAIGVALAALAAAAEARDPNPGVRA